MPAIFNYQQTLPYGPGWNSQTHSYNPPANPVNSNSGLGSYNISPGAVGGQGPYGAVPGNIGIPPSPYQQTTSLAPNLGAPAVGQLSNNILSELQGQISPQALKNMQDQAARFGISSGMPGSNAYLGSLANNKNLLGNILTTEQLQHQGAQDYLAAITGIGSQQINPALAAEIAAHNAQLNAAPDPTQAAQRQLQNYYAALNAARGPAGPSAGGGYGSPAGGTGQLGSGALGFGFGTFGQQQPTSPTGGGSFDTGVPTGYQDWNSYYSDLGGGADTSSYTLPTDYQDWNSYYSDLGG